MSTVSNNLTRKNFEKMLSGKHANVPSAIKKELKSANIGYSGTRISKQRAMKALKHLEEKKMLPSKFKRAYQIYDEAGKEQFEEDYAAKQAIIQKHVRTGIKMDIAEETREEENGLNKTKYDSRGVLGKRLIEELDEDKRKRDNEIKQDVLSHGIAATKTPIKSPKIKAPEIPDMPNDFGE